MFERRQRGNRRSGNQRKPGTQIGPVQRSINPSDHVLVLLEGLSVAVLIQREVELNSEVELIRRGLILAASESFA